MDIAYVTRSAFLATCENAIHAERTRLEAGEAVEVPLEGGGYAGRVEVEIRDADTTTFGTDWQGTDVTRFPARIRAAATALFNRQCFGRYVIEHRDGQVTIRIV
jgi:hypothetical protein